MTSSGGIESLIVSIRRGIKMRGRTCAVPLSMIKEILCSEYCIEQQLMMHKMGLSTPVSEFIMALEAQCFCVLRVAPTVRGTGVSYRTVEVIRIGKQSKMKRIPHEVVFGLDWPERDELRDLRVLSVQSFMKALG